MSSITDTTQTTGFSPRRVGSSDSLRANASFWIEARGRPVQGRLHVAFGAHSRDKVDAFYTAALEAGGRDNGAPGLREIYHPSYYAAYVLDPDRYF